MNTINTIQQRRLRQLRRRLLIVNSVIAELERLDALRRRRLRTCSGGYARLVLQSPTQSDGRSRLVR